MSGRFVPCRTTRLFPDDVIDLDVVKIGQSLGSSVNLVQGIQARFGGRCYDITWDDEISASAAAGSGVNIEGAHFELKLLGKRMTDVSVFVAVEFPDEYLIEILNKYGDFDHANIRRLKLKERGLTHIENGVRVVYFSEIRQNIPNTVVYRGIPLGFRYTGQVKLCFKCASPDHVVRDCPQKQNLPQTQATAAEQDPQETEESDDETSDGESNMDQQDKNEPTEQNTETRPGVKRPRPSSSDTEDTPTKMSQKDNSTLPTATETTAHTPALLSPQPEDMTPPADTQGETTEEPFAPAQGPIFHKFMKAIKKSGKTRTQLLKTIPSKQFSQARGMWLQSQHGDYTEAGTVALQCRDTEIAAWKSHNGSIKQDAFAELLRFYNNLTEHYDLFDTTTTKPKSS